MTHKNRAPVVNTLDFAPSFGVAGQPFAMVK
jgi:hypothetical protein